MEARKKLKNAQNCYQNGTSSLTHENGKIYYGKMENLARILADLKMKAKKLFWFLPELLE